MPVNSCTGPVSFIMGGTVLYFISVMKKESKEKKKIREPFEPHKTPEPPQIIEPNSKRERENPVEDKDRRGGSSGRKR